jgi:hypothetical protein
MTNTDALLSSAITVGIETTASPAKARRTAFMLSASVKILGLRRNGRIGSQLQSPGSNWSRGVIQLTFPPRAVSFVDQPWLLTGGVTTTVVAELGFHEFSPLAETKARQNQLDVGERHTPAKGACQRNPRIEALGPETQLSDDDRCVLTAFAT